MHEEEVNIEGIHVTIKPEWRKDVEHGIKHLESQHPGVFTRVSVRFTPVKPHHRGMIVTVDGRVDLHPFHVECQGDVVTGVLHEAFAVVLRTLQDRTKRGHHTAADSGPTEMAIEEALVDAEPEAIETAP